MSGLLRRLRYVLNPVAEIPDIPEWHRAIIDTVRPFTMGSVERLLATIAAVEYVVAHDIQGAVVECGVWRGGQMMAAALTLQHLGARRPLVLFDTFSGMTEPTDFDKDLQETSALRQYQRDSARPVGDRWCEATLDDVRHNLESTGYPRDLTSYVSGPVEQTLPEQAPAEIAYLRLDTDWYESTTHELVHLFPRVTRLGVVTIDDYGHWQGAKKAVDEYLSAHGIVCLLHRIDYTGRQFVKT